MPNPKTSKRSPITAIHAKSAPKKAERALPMPKSLPPEYRAEWRALVQHLRAIEAWVPQKSGLVEIYLLNLMAVRDAQAAMTASGGIITADGKIHPSSAIIARHSATVNKLGEQLGLGKGKLIPTADSAKPAASKPSNWVG